MDSPRGSTFTNVLMMLPMVVVPTLALLQMPENKGSLLSKLVAAATGQTEDSPDPNAEQAAASAEDIWSAIEGASASPDDEVEDAFGSMGEELSSPFGTKQELASPFNDATDTAFAEDPPVVRSTPSASPPAVLNGPRMTPVSVPENQQVSQLLTQVDALGAKKTMWFGPGGGQFGFIAFVNSGPNQVSYRFEAISSSPEAAVAEVIGKIEMWRRSPR